MNGKLILHLPPKRKIFIYGQIVWVLIMLWLRDILGFPSFVTYLTDVMAIWTLVSNINQIRYGVGIATPKTQSRIIVAMLVCITIGLVVNLVNPMLVVWAARNNLRFYLFFFMCIGLLDEWDLDKILRLLRGFFWANVLMCSFQYFVMGLSDDEVGGFFGITEGCNAYLNVLCCCVFSNVVSDFFARKMKLGKILLYLVAIIYVVVLAELKVFYVELIVMVVAAFLFVRPSWKTVVLCIIGILGIGLAVALMTKYDPDSLTLLLDMDQLAYYLGGRGYTNTGDLNRLTAIQQIQDRFFQTDPIRTLFGFGFGSCETSQFSFLQSEFAKMYGHLHYRWFTHAWIYLEQGALGVILLLAFFGSLVAVAYQMKHAVRDDLVLTAFIFTVSCVVGIVYNCALQLEACYLIAFMVAIPFVLRKKGK